MNKIFKVSTAVLGLLVTAPVVVGLILKAVSVEPPAPGQLYDVGGFKLHINCIGPETDLPTVVVEAGAGTPGMAYYWIQQNLAQTTKVCTYDRAGMGWSDDSDHARVTGPIIQQLHTLLTKAQVKTPFVFAGHSIAGIYMREYVANYPNDVAGIAFIDASHPDQLEYFTEKVEDEEEYPMGLIFSIKLMIRLGLTQLYNPIVEALPLDDFPLQVQQEFEYLTNTVSHIETMIAEEEADALVMGANGPQDKLNDLPIAVITAASVPAEEGEQTAQEFLNVWLPLQKDLASLSTNSRHVLMRDADHVSIITNKKNAVEVSGYIREIVLEVARNEAVGASR